MTRLHPQAFLLGFVLYLLKGALANAYTGSIRSQDPWQYAVRFCFQSNVTYEIHYRVSSVYQKQLWLLVYLESVYDIQEWRTLYSTGASCQVKRSRASIRVPLHENSLDGPSQTLQYYVGSFELERRRPSWGFVAFAACENTCETGYCDHPLNMTYDLQFTTMTSKNQSAIAYSIELEYYTLVYRVLLSISTYAFIFGLITMTKLHQQERTHPIVLLLFLSIVLVFVGLFMLNIYISIDATMHAAFTNPFYGIAVFLLGNSEQLLLLHVILLGKGWAIVRYKISTSGTIKVAGLFIAYYFTYWLVLTSRVYTGDLALVEFFPTTMGGSILIALRVCSAIWFGYACHTTLRNYVRKLHFYHKFLIAGLSWILLAPCGALILSATSTYLQDIYFESLVLGSMLIAQLILMHLFYPCDATLSFPFHHVTASMLTKPWYNSGEVNLAIKKDSSQKYISKRSLRKIYLSIVTTTRDLTILLQQVAHAYEDLCDEDELGSESELDELATASEDTAEDEDPPRQTIDEAARFRLHPSIGQSIQPHQQRRS